MRRSARARRARGAAAAAVAAAAVLLAGCGSSAHHASTTPPANTVPAGAPGTLRISPAHPTTRSSIEFAFTAPVTSGVHGRAEIDYSLSVTGTGGSGCVGAHEAAAPRTAKGARASLAIGPSQLGRPWCPGRYSARVIELQRAHCTGGTPCPQYIRVVAIVARATFAVRSS